MSLKNTLWKQALRPALGLSLMLMTAALPAATPEADRPAPAWSQAEQKLLDARVLEAREALRRKDRARLQLERDALVAARHPLAQWADYWELSSRLDTATQPELEAFYARWPASYVEDRLRNDWLLELGKRRDWSNLALEYPRFRMNDDREVSCYALLLRHQAGEDVLAAARELWLGPRDADSGCSLLATTLYEARRLTPADAWLKARQSTELNRSRAVRQAVGLIDEAMARRELGPLLEQPGPWLSRRATDTASGAPADLVALALIRLAASDPSAAAQQLDGRWLSELTPEAQAWVWASIARQAATRLQPEADRWFQRAARVPGAVPADWGDETQAWRVRAALRAGDAARWQRVLAGIAAMSASAQADPTWVYWKARALNASAEAGAAGDGQRMAAQLLQERLAPQFHFYGKLASEELGRSQLLPPRPAPLTAAERELAARSPGLSRALALIDLGLRNEGVREWNYGLRGLTDRELLAAAQRACDREVWDRCINTSERTRQEVDMAQRFPTPFRAEVLAVTGEIGLDPAYVYGLIRQESRFIMDARSSVGASGLMQIMPATAKWTAKRMGLNYSAEQITDRQLNLRLGTGYLKLVLDDFEGSQAMAAAAYNAGPNRPRRWREGPPTELAAWAENIPFQETRDYVKKVLSNASYYAAVMGGQSVATLKPRLQPVLVGPKVPGAPADRKELP
ncbi:soluble lytic murein transglycosylase [Sphaerotilus hippei]|uniref:Soluble lytic murein transglycosylase n=1 Tax=Sphaerotilus hippei TaxID=744406 RepID=A0A318H5J7_9BURK|nr:lytic transglycosylase domain-containing protein [Sphaerotilus hippei]PXW99190.1 soluble lytic murein transglycosylase [Sphaerotilus hippei]